MKPIKLISIKTLKHYNDVAGKANAFPPAQDYAEQRENIAKQAAEIWTEFPARVVSDLLADVNGRASTHTLAQHDVADLVKAAERRLAKAGVTIANRPGAVVTLTGGVPTAKAYARQARSAITTQIVIRRGTSAWYLDAATRIERYAGPGGHERITFSITPAAQADIFRSAMEGFTVQQPPQTVATSIPAHA